MALSPLWTVSASEQTGRRTAATKRSCVGESRSRGLSLVSPDTDDENSLVAAGSDIDNPIHRGRAGTQVMASTLVKGKLKAAREAISSKDFVKAEKAASDTLSFESSNYNARVFLAVAKLHLGQHDEAEEAYKAAIESQPQTLLAWQGLASFYEKTERWPAYIETQRKLLDLAKESNDATKCAEALQKILNARKEHGTTDEVLDTLRLFLPESPYYAVLSQLPPPDHTAPTSTTTYEAQCYLHNSLPIYEQIISTKEREEEKAINTEVDKRRQRLTTTTTAEETRRIVMREVMSKSVLPDLYKQITGHHMAPDELRRDTEEKLLKYLHTLLLCLPDPFLGGPSSAVSEAARAEEEKKAKHALKGKASIRDRVEDLAKDMVTLRLPVELAWRIVLEWKDMQDENDYDEYVLKRYMELFPEDGLSKLAQYLLHLPDPSAPNEEGEKEKKPSTPTKEELLELVDAAFGQRLQTDSPKAHVLVALCHLDARDFEAAAEIAEAGISLLKTIEGQIGQKLPGTMSVLQTILAVALVHSNPPHYHLRAQRLLDTLLQKKPDDWQCLLGKAYICLHADKYEDAYNLFDRVHETLPSSAKNHDRVKFECRCERAWALGNIRGRRKDALDELHEVASVMDKDETIERVDKAKSWWRYGQVLWLIDEPEYLDKAQQSFIVAIKRDNTYSAAFTSLGFYYLREGEDGKATALQFFQKAFELDEGEVEAARVLVADFYSKTEDWDLVEGVSRRVIRNLTLSSGASAGKMVAEGDENPLTMGSVAAKKYAWAWKAIGAADLKSKRYPQAITALQGAIRGASSDHHAYIQLAQAYRGAGKHIAALKTLTRVVRELDLDNWHAWFLIGDIQKQLGLFDSAIETFARVEALIQKQNEVDSSTSDPDHRTTNPDSIVIKISLIETYYLLACAEIRNNLLHRAVDSLMTCLNLSQRTLDEYSNAPRRIIWKFTSDAFLKLGEIVNVDHLEQEGAFDLHRILQEVLERLVQEEIDAKNPVLKAVLTTRQVEGLLTVDKDKLNLRTLSLSLGTLSCSLRMLLEDPQDEGIGSSWFDLGLAVYRLKPFCHHLVEVSGQKQAHKQEEMTLQAILCLKKALSYEPLNGTFWNLLGVLASENHAKLAQHSLIRACELNVRSAVPWANLGLFYYIHEDYELANKCFLRAQVLDPDYTVSWIGQGLLAQLHGDHQQYDVLMRHAEFVGNGIQPEADFTSARIIYDRHDCVSLPASNSPVGPSHDNNDLVHASFLLARYTTRNPAEPTAHHLAGLIYERLQSYVLAVSSFSKTVKLLEEEYELDETEEIERRFCVANVSLARAKIAARHDLLSAMDHLETGLGLLQNRDDFASRALAIQSQLLKGMATYFLDDFAACLASFEEAQSLLGRLTGEEQKDVALLRRLRTQGTLLLAGVLYATGGTEQLAEAERQLLDNIYEPLTNTPDIQVVTTLSALAILTANSELLEASLAEILKLPIDQRLSSDPAKDSYYLLACEKIFSGRSCEEAVRVLSHAVHDDVTSLEAQQELKAVLDGVDSQQNDGVGDHKGSQVAIQHSIHDRPWETARWDALA